MFCFRAVVLARMLEQNLWKFLQQLLAMFFASLSVTPIQTPDYSVQHCISAMTSCKQDVLLTADSCIHQEFSSQMRCRLCAVQANKLLCRHSTFYYCSLGCLVSAQRGGCRANDFCGWLSWNIWKKVVKQPYLMGERREHGSTMHLARS